MTSEPTICFTNDTTSPDIVRELDIRRLDAKLVDQQFFELCSFPLLKGSQRIHHGSEKFNIVSRSPRLQNDPALLSHK